MIDGRRVVVWTPYGRQVTYSVQVPYLVRAHLDGVVDKVHLYMNLDDDHQANDRAYADMLCDRYPTLFEQLKRPGPETPELRGQIPDEWFDGYRQPKQMNTGRYFVYAAQDPDSIYVRLDDDIVWMERNALRNLVRFKLDHPEYLGVFPIIWNNAICSWVLQQWGHVPHSWGTVQPYATCSIGWGSPVFAEQLHHLLLHHIEHGHEDACVEPDRWEVLGEFQQFSVSCFAIDGHEYVDREPLLPAPGVLDFHEEEHWLTQHRPWWVKRRNVVYGGAHVSHLSFFTQRDFLLTRTDVLPRYYAVADTVAGQLPEAWRWH